MNTLNNYILEKLRIDKNIKIKNSIEINKNDVIVRISIVHYYATNQQPAKTYLELNRNSILIMRFVEFKDNQVIFSESPYFQPDQFRSEQNKTYVNSHGYYECNVQNKTSRLITIYTNKETGLEIINIIKNHIKHFGYDMTDLNILDPYFDTDLSEIHNVHCNCDNIKLNNIYNTIYKAQ